MPYSSVSTIWVLVGAALVFFMQAGFAMVETGFTRAKNAGNIIMKNLMDFCIGTPIFWLVGFGLMFGSSSALVGGIDLLTQGAYTAILPEGVPKWAFFVFQTVFCATAATIVSGAMAERTKFVSYCIYSAVISAVVYPISGHWIWGGGWLAQMGFHDFAGSTAVHMVGGVAAFVGALILGPRIGKYDKNGRPRAILGHSLTLGALGVFILWFCWFGFNGGSTVSAEGAAIPIMGHIFTTTNLAAAVSTLTVMIVTWVRYKKPDVSMTLNGTLAGLVAITAGCDAVDTNGAFFIGLIAGFVVVVGIEFIDKVLKVDDPVGAVGVHGLCGASGTLLTGLFSCGNNGVEKGLFYGGGWHLLGVQALGVVSVIAWVVVTMTAVFLLIKKTIGLRASREEELKGLDVTEHGIVSAYGDFQMVPQVLTGEMSAAEDEPAPPDEAVPLVHLPDEAAVLDESTGRKLTKVVVVFNQGRLESLKTAMNSIGVTGMTVTQVLGYGVQKGRDVYYRGVKLEEAKLLPKMKVEIVVSKVPVQAVVDAARQALYTGSVGDGKIFLYDVENVIRVRTGEQGYDALQGDDQQ